MRTSERRGFARVDRDGLPAANELGQLGDGGETSRATPMPVAGLSATAIALNGDFSCALSGGHYRCWGDNAQGELGDGSTKSKSEPTPVSWK